jgi:hypothetical protein
LCFFLGDVLFGPSFSGPSFLPMKQGNSIHMVKSPGVSLHHAHHITGLAPGS